MCLLQAPKCLSHIVDAHTCKPYRYRHIAIWKHTNMPMFKARFDICLLLFVFLACKEHIHFLFVKRNVFIGCMYVKKCKLLNSIYVFNCLHSVCLQLVAFNVVIVYFHLFLFNYI